MELKIFYHGNNLTDICWFFQKVDLEESDPMKTDRTKLFARIIKAPGNTAASGNIYWNLVSEIFAVAPRNEG